MVGIKVPQLDWAQRRSERSVAKSVVRVGLQASGSVAAAAWLLKFFYTSASQALFPNTTATTTSHPTKSITCFLCAHSDTSTLHLPSLL